ncbi:MAG: Na+/H+ antiporter [Gemmatimonadetes bacterium]|nr:Na+/H+ antiporter [Gemmatimonadota bacterium]
MVFENAFIILFCVATAVAMVVRRYQMPYTVALVLAGVAIGTLGVVEAPHLTKELLFAVFLPGLLFEAAFHLDFGRFRQNEKTILSLAVPGVVAAIAITGALTTWVVQGLALDPTFTLPLGMVFGALVAATDPIAVVALFRSLSVPRRLSVLVEGESLLNDGTAIVFFTLILSYVTGEAPTTGSLVVSFLKTTIGGALIGLAVGAMASQVTKRVDEPAIEITLTVIAAYGSFVLAEQYHLSGVIATVAAGMVCGNYGRRYGMSPTTRIAVESFWEYIAFALNSMVFLLLGFDASLSALGGYWREILAAGGAVIAARFGVVYAVTGLLRGTSERVPRNWTGVLAWGGVRGALSIVLALGLPRDLPHRDQLVTMTIGVVLLSILLQGLTMAPLLRWLGLVKASEGALSFDRARADLRVSSLALQEITHLQAQHAISDDDVERLSTPYRERMVAARAEVDALQAGDAELPLMRRLQVVRHLLAFERDTASEDLRQEVIVPATHEGARARRGEPVAQVGGG